MRSDNARRTERAAVVELSNGDTTPTTQARERSLLIRDLGWSDEEAAETYHRFRSFEDDWNAPEMDVYDDL